MTPQPSILPIRIAISDEIPDIEPSQVDDNKSICTTYIPSSHVKALRPENTIVEGMRGAGKSFWTAALSSKKHLQHILNAFPDTKTWSNTNFSVGFSAEPKEGYPSSRVLELLSKEAVKDNSHDAIWLCVLATVLKMPTPFPSATDETWQTKYNWVKSNPEPLDRFFYNYDKSLDSKNATHLVLFDALDRLAKTWEGVRPLAKSLFQTALEFQSSYKNIHLKLFVRPDMLEDNAIRSFPDCSKLLAKKVSLEWRKIDLFALLYQSLANATNGGAAFREMAVAALQKKDLWNSQHSGIYTVPRELQNDEVAQKKLFEAIAGKHMATESPSSHKRGFPYTWLPNHLLDGCEQVSPRSFLAALRKAAEYTPSDTWIYPLHFQGIKKGVQSASEIRVQEICEDYPWVETAFSPFRNVLHLPTTSEEMIRLWKEDGTIAKIAQNSEKLSPLHLNQGENGLLQDIEFLGMINRVGKKSAIQMPDVYRVAFSIIRKGGVPRLR